MKEKRGQFYLLAAIILITIIIGFASVSNYLEKKDDIRLYNLGEELKIESKHVLDYGTYNEKNDTATQELIEGFIEKYATYIEAEIDIYFIFGNKKQIIIVGYQELTKDTPIIKIGEKEEAEVETTPGKKTTIKGVYDREFDEVTITIDDNDYIFKLGEGENFYFVISQKIGEDIYVVTG